MMDKDAPIYVAGHRGLIGSAFVRRLAHAGYRNVIVRSRAELDLADRGAVLAFFERVRPRVVVLAAGRVGGILENMRRPAEFILDNLRIEINVLEAARLARAERVFFFASSCMYPRDCPQPMAEAHLLGGRPEETSLPYAISKLAGLQACLALNRQYRDTLYIPVIPNSAYGPNDNFDPDSAHVLAALIRRFHDAKTAGEREVVLWGSGTPRREFVHADDVADACLFLMDAALAPEQLPLNIGTGADHSIRELAQIVAQAVGYAGGVRWDASRPEGAPRKLLDCSRLRGLGWSGPKVSLAEGVRSTYHWFLGRSAGRAR
ncbi:MAG TPA: GDP-L-fucose synthase [Burkholderiales bacterium]|nr:GDP-L-fucose synthase [Burkholderiales bacterium]